MPGRARKSGINILGEIPWGTHICQFYTSEEDIAEVLIPYFKAGLENNEFCIWITSEPLNARKAGKMLRKAINNMDYYFDKAQMEIFDAAQLYSRLETYEIRGLMRNLLKREKEILRRGFDGIRIAGIPYWVGDAGCGEAVSGLAEYENEVNDGLRHARAIILCCYPLHKCGTSEIIDIVSSQGLSE